MGRPPVTGGRGMGGTAARSGPNWLLDLKFHGLIDLAGRAGRGFVAVF